MTPTHVLSIAGLERYFHGELGARRRVDEAGRFGFCVAAPGVEDALELLFGVDVDQHLVGAAAKVHLVVALRRRADPHLVTHLLLPQLCWGERRQTTIHYIR